MSIPNDKFCVCNKKGTFIVINIDFLLTCFLYSVTLSMCVLKKGMVFEENWDLKVKAVAKMSFLVCLFALYSQKYVPVLVV